MGCFPNDLPNDFLGNGGIFPMICHMIVKATKNQVTFFFFRKLVANTDLQIPDFPLIPV